jgi:hypothetical protein
MSSSLQNRQVGPHLLPLEVPEGREGERERECVCVCLGDGLFDDFFVFLGLLKP